ncbi:hypothetical protein OXX80_004123 [Metschnikowia pulcherrima]
MKSILVLTWLAVAYAHDLVFPGSLYVSRIEGIPEDEDLRFEGTSLIAGGEMATFEYDLGGTFKSADTGDYISVDDSGMLVPSSEAHVGFSLREIPNVSGQRTLLYKGSDEFQLCADSSIGFRSNCEGARAIEITYEDHHQAAE